MSRAHLKAQAFAILVSSAVASIALAVWTADRVGVTDLRFVVPCGAFVGMFLGPLLCAFWIGRELTIAKNNLRPPEEK